MEFVDYGHNTSLVAMSFVVSLVAGFTGLSLTKNLSEKTITQKKLAVALASVALGGGIWSMHFVAMLGLQMPILFYYDAAITLASALLAILVVASALVLLHFVTRTPQVIVGAGALVGFGILGMHYLGMAGLQLCRPVYSVAGVFLSSVAAILLCVLAFGVAYGARTNKRIVLGTVCFGFAVGIVHFAAMAGTKFVAVEGAGSFGPSISNETMALGVILSSFVIFGGFLWVGSTYLEPAVAGPAGGSESEPEPELEAAPIEFDGFRIPCERDGGKVFVAPEDVAFVRADGHYTQVYTESDRLFCVWPITEASKRLLPKGYLKVHRSYLVNPAKVAGFERTKDKGKCTFASESLPPAPVSRANLKDVQALLAGGG